MGQPVIPLRGTSPTAHLAGPLSQTVWPIGGKETLPSEWYRHAVIAGGEDETFGLRLTTGRASSLVPPTVELPAELHHLGAGDVISVSPDGKHIRVLWRAASRLNSVLLTERCDNYCLMCSQPPRERDDTWLLKQAHDLIDVLPADTPGIGFTGGEPTLYGDALIELLAHCSERLPVADIHLLSNGRRFADPHFADAYASLDNPRLMVGIPVYGTEPTLHDYVVQAEGAFNETIQGILNLAERDQRIELRVVVHQQTIPALIEIASYIARNLPFVEQVALMGLELMGFARTNLDILWADPHDYRSELTEAALLLEAHGVRTLVYNHQLCVLDEEIWHLAVRSISDWKNDYLAVCEGCAVLADCGGFFTSSQLRRSPHIRPIAVDQFSDLR